MAYGTCSNVLQGFFSSRARIKQEIRVAEANFRAADILLSFALHLHPEIVDNRVKTMISKCRENLAILQVRPHRILMNSANRWLGSIMTALQELTIIKFLETISRWQSTYKIAQ